MRKKVRNYLRVTDNSYYLNNSVVGSSFSTCLCLLFLLRVVGRLILSLTDPAVHTKKRLGHLYHLYGTKEICNLLYEMR